MSRQRRFFVGWFCLLLLLPGCGSPRQEDLKWVGIVYHGYHDQNRRGPPGWEEFIDFAEKNSASNTHPDSLKRIRDAGYTVQWSVEFQTLQGTKDGMSATVLAEHPTDKSQPKLMMDGSVKYPK